MNYLVPELNEMTKFFSQLELIIFLIANQLFGN